MTFINKKYKKNAVISCKQRKYSLEICVSIFLKFYFLKEHVWFPFMKSLLVRMHRMCEEFVSSYELYILRYELINKLQNRKINHRKYDDMQDS